MRRTLLLIGCLTAALTAAACEETADQFSAAFGSPIDFSYACGGATKTFRPSTFDDVDDESLCNPDGDEPASLLGVVLNRDPARVHVLQMTPSTDLPYGVIDADRFVPGFSGIPVDTSPLRLLRNEDWSAFYILSSGGQSLQRLVIHGFDENNVLDYTLDAPVSLPGPPADAVLTGDVIWVASATDNTLWTYTISSDGSLSEPVIDDSLPAQVHTMQLAGDQLLLTWVERPVVTLMNSGDQTIVAEASLKPECGDGLDNDDDGLADAQDPDCRNSVDQNESGGLTERPADDRQTAQAYPPELPPCEDQLDNNGDGLTDSQDPTCADNPYGEWTPECSDGLDNNGDGLIDGDDPACYGAHDSHESHIGSAGTYRAAFVDGGQYGRFIYVLDPQETAIQVFAVGVDGDDNPSMTPVDVPGTDADVAALDYAGYDGNDSGTLPSSPRRAYLGPAQQGEAGLMLGSLVGTDLSAGQLRGELWSHIVSDRRVTPGNIDWTPRGCDLSSTDEVCVQPDLDDATWYVFMPTQAGTLLLIEAIRRGVPLHRFAQAETDPEDRTGDVEEPVLGFRGEAFSFSEASTIGAPFLGPSTEEELVEEVEDVSPALFRRFGIWPPEYSEAAPGAVDLEGVPTEIWTLTYEGVIPDTTATRGRFLDETTFYDPGAAFCDAGVEVGDWLTLQVAPSSVAEVARTQASVTTDDGRTCALEETPYSFIDIPVTSITPTTLSVDLSEARIRPNLPALDEDTIDADNTLSMSTCENARRAVDIESQVVPAALSTADLPRMANYAVRTAGTWAVVGSRSGFLHPNRWDGTACTPDPATLLDARYNGRLSQRNTAELYDTCPPPLDQMAHDADAPMHTQAADRFANFSFSLDVFQGCEQTADGIVAKATQRGTRWAFAVEGPDEPLVTSADRLNLYAASVLHGTRVPQLELRRQQIQLDTGGRRLHILQIRANDLDHIASFE